MIFKKNNYFSVSSSCIIQQRNHRIITTATTTTTPYHHHHHHHHHHCHSCCSFIGRRWIIGVTVAAFLHYHSHHPLNKSLNKSSSYSTSCILATKATIVNHSYFIHQKQQQQQQQQRSNNNSNSLLQQAIRTNQTTTTNTNKNMTTTDINTSTIWNGINKEQFASLDHPGYSTQSDPITHVGGWLAHRRMNDNSNDNDLNMNNHSNNDWIQTDVVPYVTKLDYTCMPIQRPPKILVLYGSLRASSYSRKLAYEMARLLEVFDCDVRVYNPMGLPVRNPDDNGEQHMKVNEIRALTLWSDGHVWVSPEMHGTITGVFINQIDWIPLNTGSIRPTQGKTCCVAQINGGSQSFNAVNTLRILARWMRMPCCTNQSSVPKAWQEFDDMNHGRMKPSDYRNRVVDVIEEFVKFTAVMVPVSDHLTDRYSERMEILNKGRILSQAEKEKDKTIDASRKA